MNQTEIAIRAAFKAVADGKQVAVLVPTTILALQHFNTFSARLKNFPCSVDYICRLRTAKQQKETLDNLKSGKTDIIIGTHRLVGKDVSFKDLGLLIIDEEQKGVGDILDCESVVCDKFMCIRLCHIFDPTRKRVGGAKFYFDKR